MKPCPNCGVMIDDHASFCPHCAQPVNDRKALYPPRHMPRRAVYTALILLAAAAALALLMFWLRSRPKIYDPGSVEAVYSDRNDSFHLYLAKWNDVQNPASENRWFSELNHSYRYPVCLCITRTGSDVLLTDTFMESVASVTVEVAGLDLGTSVSCDEPQPDKEFVPDAASVIYVDYKILSPGEHEVELICTITMKNGDVIRLRQSQQYPSTTTYKFTAQNAPMDTIQELQEFVDGLAAITNEADTIYLYLPPVVYEGGLRITDRLINLSGSAGTDGQYTTFTGPIHSSHQRGISEFDNISFLGNGQGVGVRASDGARIHLNNCQVSGWETGFLADGNAWIAANETVFEHNVVGLCFNAEQGAVSDPFYLNDTFRNNGTAVLLERVPNATALSFPDTLFEGNGQDFDNRCGQALELDGTVFQ